MFLHMGRRLASGYANGPATVGEASAGIRVSKPAISKHLRVDFQKARGTTEYFSLDVYLRDDDRVFLTNEIRGRGTGGLTGGVSGDAAG
jgi:hypothetical protein